MALVRPSHTGGTRKTQRHSRPRRRYSLHRLPGQSAATAEDRRCASSRSAPRISTVFLYLRCIRLRAWATELIGMPKCAARWRSSASGYSCTWPLSASQSSLRARCAHSTSNASLPQQASDRPWPLPSQTAGPLPPCSRPPSRTQLPAAVYPSCMSCKLYSTYSLRIYQNYSEGLYSYKLR